MFTFNRTSKGDKNKNNDLEDEKGKDSVVAVEGTVTHPFVLNGWREGAIVLEWDGDRALVPCEQIEEWATVNSSAPAHLGLPGLRWTEDWLVNSSSVDQLLESSSLESHGLAIAGNSLYLAKSGQLSDEGLLLCLGEMRINLTAREGGGCEESEWCAAKV